MWYHWQNSIFVLILLLFFKTTFQTQLLSDFLHFIEVYNKPYTYGSAEFSFRLKSFKENLQLSKQLNLYQNVSSAQYGITKFSDLTPQEFKERYLTDLRLPQQAKFPNQVTPIEKLRSLSIPKKHDWRNFNNRSYVTAVKNQDSCGGCWAFSTVETLESMFAIQKQKTPLELSVQEVIDCAEWNYGCAGGDFCLAFEWLENSHVPVVTNKVYPLTDKSDFCDLLPKSPVAVKVHNHTCHDYARREDEILQLLYNVGPVAVSVDATSWPNYMGGIIRFHCEDRVNHAVVIVGYDLTGDVPYYIVRNSWGPDYGLGGYLHVEIGGNLCGIAGHVAAVNVY